jgi:hypothetical protein
VVFGVPVSLRHRAELNDQVGYYSSILPVRVRCASPFTKAEAMAEAVRAYRSASQHRSLPYDEIVAAAAYRSGNKRGDLFDVVVKYDLEPDVTLPDTTMDITKLDLPTFVSDFPVVIDVTRVLNHPPGKPSSLVIEYDPRRVDRELAQGLAARLREAVQSAVVQ